MSTHVVGFQSLFRFFASFCIGQISHQQHKVRAFVQWSGCTYIKTSCTGLEINWSRELRVPLNSSVALSNFRRTQRCTV